MDECNIFREQLAITYPSKGHALWDPGIKHRTMLCGLVGLVCRIPDGKLPTNNVATVRYQELVHGWLIIYCHGTVGYSVLYQAVEDTGRPALERRRRTDTIHIWIPAMNKSVEKSKSLIGTYNLPKFIHKHSFLEEISTKNPTFLSKSRKSKG